MSAFQGLGLGLNSTRETKIPSIRPLPAQTVPHPHGQQVLVPCPPHRPHTATRFLSSAVLSLCQLPVGRPTFISADCWCAVLSEHLEEEPSSDCCRLCLLRNLYSGSQCAEIGSNLARPPSQGEWMEMRKGEWEKRREIRQKYSASLTLQLSLYLKQFWFSANKPLVAGSLMHSDRFAHKYGREAVMCSPPVTYFPEPTARWHYPASSIKWSYVPGFWTVKDERKAVLLVRQDHMTSCTSLHALSSPLAGSVSLRVNLGATH